MAELVALEHLGLRDQGPTLTLSLHGGQSLVVVGPAGAGKTHLLRILAGDAKPLQGTVRLTVDAHLPESPLPRRAKVQSLVRGIAGGKETEAHILTAAGLWDRKNDAVADLSPSQTAAAEMLPLLAVTDGLLLIDGHLDLLDPWTLARVLARLEEQKRMGVVVAASTHRPELLASFDLVVVLHGSQVRFAGSIDDLLRHGPPHTIEVATERRAAVRALVEPFAVSVEETPDGLRMQAAEGQALAAKLLLEGYGDVKLVVRRSATLEEALLSLA